MLKRIRLKWQVVAVVGIVQFLGLAAGAVLLLANARTAVEVEVAASEDSARALVLLSLGGLVNGSQPDTVTAALAERLVRPRHVRISVFDARTGYLPLPAVAPDEHEAAAPQWFAKLITPRIRETRLPIVVDGLIQGHVLMTTEPHDEIAEVWQDARALIGVAAATYAASMGLLVLVVGRALRPLDALHASLRSLEHGDLTLQVPDVEGADLAPLVTRVNALTTSLRRTEAERSALHRKLVEVGDAERKAIAMELHDELGPCLFGLKVKAAAIRRAAGARGTADLARDADEILAIVDQIQASNRRLLTTLRPMAIGQLPLRDLVIDLVAGFRQRHSDVEWTFDLPETLPTTEETFDLTVFRFFQEAVTNALKHGKPSRIRVALATHPTRAGATEVRLAVEDNGRGIAEGAGGQGRGLPAMRDRIAAIGGQLTIGCGPEDGTEITASLPLSQRTILSVGIEAAS